MSFESMTDTVSLIKKDGRRFDNILADVQPKTIFIDDASLPIEEGDRITRKLPNNLTESYLVLDRGYYASSGSIQAHYQVKVRKETTVTDDLLSQASLPSHHSESYVDLSRLNDLRVVTSQQFDLTKLIRHCEELNKCYANECFLSVAMLIRAMLDHVPPIFGCKSFSEVANNYKGATKSFKESMQNLENSSRKIADSHLHVQIRKKEVLPNKTQVNFSNDLDVLLAEIVRILK
jgi:hypothetical protein